MAELTILDDPAIEAAVLVDLDMYQPLPIMAVGPDRRALLQAFADSVPFDLTLLKDEPMREAFSQFLSSRGVLDADAGAALATDTLVDDSRNGSDDADALAELEASDATDTPAEQPADVDADASAQTTEVKAKCWNCEGNGKIEFGDGSPAMTCNVCEGKGWIMQTVPA